MASIDPKNNRACNAYHSFESHSAAARHLDSPAAREESVQRELSREDFELYVLDIQRGRVHNLVREGRSRNKVRPLYRKTFASHTTNETFLAKELDSWTKIGERAVLAAQAKLQAEEREGEAKLDLCIDRENAFWSQKGWQHSWSKNLMCAERKLWIVETLKPVTVGSVKGYLQSSGVGTGR